MEEGACYITRPAEAELCAALLRHEFCYLVAPPRCGKSTLRERAAERLKGQGVQCATIDLSKMGEQVSPEGFCYALIGQIAEGLALKDPTVFFTSRAKVPPVVRWAAYLREEFLVAVPQPVVIFIDEIDAVRAIRASGGADELFASIRQVFTDRAGDAACRRLTFCLIGAAAPYDLVRDPGLIPLDIARLIELGDFTPAEAEGLLPGLARLDGGGGGGEARAALAKILGWTDGHPYLTLRLCEARLCEPGAFGPIDERVDRLVDKIFLKPGTEEPCLNALSRRFEDGGAESARLQTLSLYRRLLYGERVPAQREDRVQLELRVVQEELREERQMLRDERARRRRERAALVSIAAGTALSAVLTVSVLYGWGQRARRAEADIRDKLAAAEGRAADREAQAESARGLAGYAIGKLAAAAYSPGPGPSPSPSIDALRGGPVVRGGSPTADARAGAADPLCG